MFRQMSPLVQPCIPVHRIFTQSPPSGPLQDRFRPKCNHIRILFNRFLQSPTFIRLFLGCSCLDHITLSHSTSARSCIPNVQDCRSRFALENIVFQHQIGFSYHNLSWDISLLAPCRPAPPVRLRTTRGRSHGSKTPMQVQLLRKMSAPVSGHGLSSTIPPPSVPA